MGFEGDTGTTLGGGEVSSVAVVLCMIIERGDKENLGYCMRTFRL